MQLFACTNCHAAIFFDNYVCTNCGSALAFLPDLQTMSALAPLPVEVGPTAAEGKVQAAPQASAEDPAPTRYDSQRAPPGACAQRYAALARHDRIYRMCQNHSEYAACNWAVPDEDPEPLCCACRLNNVIPDLTRQEQREAWRCIEAAKRWLLYSLYSLGLPVESRAQRPQDGLAFAFMAGSQDGPVFTGHSDGLITLNVAEADDPFREKIRAQLGEPYRTVLGHFRHEIGHYYWDRLVKDSHWLSQFREAFGDEQSDYQEALDRHYKEGATQSWRECFVSQYAAMHPWEDWAETWAHYLHIYDTLETAKAHGLRVRVSKGDEGDTVVDIEAVRVDDFDQLVADWVPLTLALNSLNRSMGLPDLYPFVLTETTVRKLRFVHEVIRAAKMEEAVQPARRKSSA